ncbi:MAG: AEC family transporter, partial [Paracoccaceae bacterium]
IFVRNPLFLATVLGVAFSYYSIPVPVAAGNLLEMLALTAGPTALFALGLSLVGHPVLGNLREVAWLVALKLVAQPLATWLVIRQFPEIDPFWSMSAVVLAAMPLGSTAYVLAQQYGVAVRVTSATVALSTACSIVTLTALIVLFGVD